MQPISFDLPEELIAKEPARPRDHARLLVYDRKTREISDHHFYELVELLPKDTTLVVNNSKVENCRWLFPDIKAEVFVLEKMNDRDIRGMVKPGRKFKLGKTIQLTDVISAEVLAIDEEGLRTLRLNINHDDDRLEAYEHVPLPPYIPQNDKLADDYQTVYADPLGSKAAPTAGLHFTDELIGRIKAKFNMAELTLHVGLGTFAPLTQKQIDSGHLHAEYFAIDADNAKKLTTAKHITAVGTTSSRTLESLDDLNSAKSGWTDILIKPGYEFKHVDSLITNFHLPGTSLLLLVEAFIGSRSETERVYAHAISEKYRFYSFGDAMLII